LSLIKRSECLVFFFRDEKLHCKNYLTGIEVATSPILVSVLQVLGRWCGRDEVERLLAGYSPVSIRRTLTKLRQCTLLVYKGSAEAERESALAPWKVWGEEARLRENPQPAQLKHYPHCQQLSLPRPKLLDQSEFQQVLLARRTHRRFAPGALSLESISVILHLTWGITGYLRWPGLGRLVLKTSPSGGARQPLEVYLLALRVAGLRRGIYHYRADRHCLETLRRGASEDRLVELCAGQDWIRECSALFVMTAVLPRMMWRYRFSRAYRVLLLEAGHFCQTFCLVATWLGLAPFCTAALLDEELEREIGLDGASETVLYAAGVGLKMSQNQRLKKTGGLVRA
jgi:SagB-type dehydrogenase family enzyme